MKTLAQTAAIAISASLLAATPASAQDQGGDRINMVIAYSEDECPEASEEGEIVVCEILVEAERYRIPSNLRQSDSPDNTAWARRVDRIRYIGEFGTLSCSPVGAGGITGCTEQLIDAAYADRSEGENVRFSQLIDQARQERLSTIDADAAAEQSRVEAIEREYLERLERERSQPLPGEVEQVAPSTDDGSDTTEGSLTAPPGETPVGPSEDEPETP